MNTCETCRYWEFTFTSSVTSSVWGRCKFITDTHNEDLVEIKTITDTKEAYLRTYKSFGCAAWEQIQPPGDDA